MYVWILLTSFLLSSTASFAVSFPSQIIPLAVPLYMDGREKGIVQMLITPNPQQSFVEAKPIVSLLKSRLTSEKIKLIESSISNNYLKISDISTGGVNINFDDERVVLFISIPSENKLQQSLSAKGTFDLSDQTVTPPDPVSAYINLRGSQGYVDRSFDGENQGRQPLGMSTDGALNINGWVLEGSGDFLESNSVPWQRDNTRLVHDLPDKMVRFAGGDLSYPVEGFQSFQPMLGLTMARDFTLQPYRVTEPTGQTSFFLKSPSRVDIFVNGHKIKTLQLPSGTFDIRDFPVVNGSNDVQLVITDSSGQVEIKNIDIVSDTSLLADGLHRYAYNVGIVSTVINRKIIYDNDTPVISAFHRYGLTSHMTIGTNLQGDKDQQMGGVETTFGTEWGILRVDFAGSHLMAGSSNGVAWQAQYQLVHQAKAGERGLFAGARTLTFASNYKERRFAALGTLLPNNLFSYSLITRYSQQLSPTLNMGLGGSYEFGRDGQSNDWIGSVSLNKQFFNDIRIGLNIQQQFQEGFGVFLNLIWTPRGSRHSVSSSYDSQNKIGRADWNYAEEGRADSFSATAGLAKTAHGNEGVGGATYYNNRGEITARHDIVSNFDASGVSRSTESRSDVNFATAIAYSGGHVAFSRPISNSFAMFTAHPALAGYPVGINPQGGSDDNPTYEAQTDSWGPIVLPDITPYLYRTVRVDGSRLPPGFDGGADSYTLYPSYRSGTLIEIGSGANVLLDGTLKYKDGSPVVLQAGNIYSAADHSIIPQTFFTNKTGRFRIEKLHAGKYLMELYSFPGVTVPTEISADAAGAVQAGTLTVPALPAQEGEDP